MNLDLSPEDHLQPLELAELLERIRRREELSAGSAPLLSGSISASQAGDLHPHLAHCLICLEHFQNMAAFDNQLESLKSAPSTPRGADCPEATVWRQIAVALTPSDEALAHLRHASRCDHCGPLLREAVFEMDGKISQSEAKQIAALESARAEWQERLAHRITRTPVSAAPRPWWKSWASAPRLALSGAGLAAIIVAVSWLALKETRPVPPTGLLASAYSDQRTFELRIAGAHRAPVRVERGPEGSFLSRPAALLKAEAIIAAQIESHASDPNWLQAKARADLLEGKYDSAVDALRHALQISPKSPSLLIDLGTAYFQRAQMAERQEDLGAAYESLSQALAIEPENPVALFNRAIVAENQFLLHQALDDWDHYLRVDHGSDWAAEARQRADQVRAKVKDHDQSHAAPVFSPAQIAARSVDPDLRAQLDERVEEYLHEAVRSWLPQAYPEGQAAPDPGARQALFFLAELTAEQHGDHWLSDLLAKSFAPRFPQAVVALAAAVEASDTADYDNSAKRADMAGQLFGASGNRAGALYAQFQQSFSDQMLRHTGECRRNASSALEEAGRHPYSWLQVQLSLEKAVCSLLGNDDWGVDERLSRQAMDRAQSSRYDSLYLRALYFVAEDQMATGNMPAGLKSASIGLGRFWSAQIPAIRAYNIYALLGSTPEITANRPHLVMAIWRDATALIDSGDDFLVRARAHSSAARAATAVHQPRIAEQQYAEAARLFALTPKTDAIQSDILWNEIHTAGVEARLGQVEPGIARLTRIQDELRPNSDKNVVEAFYATLGELELSGHHAERAERAFRSALESAEQRLISLNSEAERINWSKEAAPVYLGMAESQLRQGHIAESLEYFEWYLGAGSRSGERGRNKLRRESALGPPSLSARLPLLSGRTVLAYSALPGGLAIWTYDDRGINAQWIEGSNQDLQELAAGFYELASSPRSEMTALKRDAKSLYGALIAPVEQRLEPGRTLVIEADGWLAQVPFEALLDASGHYLIERAAIVHSLGQGTDALLHEGPAISKELPSLIVASSASSENEGLVPLPDVVAEADTVASDFDSANVLKGRKATLRTVEKDLPPAAVFHFSGHSLARTTGSGLMLPADEPEKNAPVLLGADKFRLLDLRNLQLAVLSTCNTESGNDGSRGFNSIAEALQRNGVPHVVASRWAVDSLETRQFIQSFYSNALSGHPVSEAIRQTARTMMANPRTSHPYYWSAFSAYGRP